MKLGILDMYKYLPVVALVVGIVFVFFAGDTYRYPCQDPANWASADCQPPVCTATGTCTEDLITPDGEQISAEEMQAMVDNIKATEKAIDSMAPTEPAAEEPVAPLYEEVK